jgi:hypothetical protein
MPARSGIAIIEVNTRPHSIEIIIVARKYIEINIVPHTLRNCVQGSSTLTPFSIILR